MSPRTLPAPWRVEQTEGGHFVVNDATGFSICYVYARKDEALRSIYMTHAEAVVIAEAIAKVPEAWQNKPAELACDSSRREEGPESSGGDPLQSSTGTPTSCAKPCREPRSFSDQAILVIVVHAK